MEAAAPAPENEPDPERGYVGRIPVRNLWLLMLYASEFFHLRGKDRAGQEDNPDDLPDLIAEVLAHAVAERQRRQLSLGYRTREAALNRVRGRIDVLATERRQLLSRGLVACRFGELTIDTPRNRFVRAALEAISRLVRRHDLAHRCRKLANDMKAMGVSGVPPTRRQMSADRFGRHDAGRSLHGGRRESWPSISPCPRREPAPMCSPCPIVKIGGYASSSSVRWAASTRSCCVPLDGV